MGPDGTAPQDAQAFIAALDEVDLARFRVVGTYTRYDEAVRNALQDARQKILAGFERPGRKRENHLIWAAPGTGKTYFVQQVAASLGDSVRYHEINLAKCSEAEFQAALGRLNDGQASLCLIDEADAKPHEPWPYEVLLPYLDAAVERGARFVFVLAGSSGSSLDDLKQRVATRPKGTDLLSRIPTGHEHVIGPMSLGDRLLIVLSQLRQAGAEADRDIRAIEKLGLYYVALNPRLANARQLREFAVRAVERVPKTDHRVKYDNLFVPGDPENKTFWAQAHPVADYLGNAYVVLTGDLVMAVPSRAVSTRLADGATVATLAVGAEARPRTNLPRQLTSFIGREREIEEVKRLLPTTALLTLRGPGGCGKTRLAFEVAGAMLAQYPDGVWVAELAALSDPALVPKIVASALDIPEQPGRALTDTLKDILRPKSLLLVLDNCEHLVGACAELADAVLRSCPNIRVLATSREPLGIPGEIVWAVPPLSTPRLTGFQPLEYLGQFDAVRLFVERAASGTPGFTLTTGNAVAVAHVCRQLEGIPLAIELAAARTKVLTVEQIAARLDDRFRLLTGGGRTTLPRHQTLRATMDWSYELLSGQEREALSRLSVFAGGWTLEAAEGVCAEAGLQATAILDLLASLVDKSLVTVESHGGDTRYRLLETVRQYSAEKLANVGDGEVRRRHRDWYLALAEDADSRLRGPEQKVWVDRLEVEQDNLRAALQWSSAEPSEADAGLRLVAALHWFWYMRNHLDEGLEWLKRLLASSLTASGAVRATALFGMGILARRQGDYKTAETALQDSLARFRELKDPFGIGVALHHLAHIADDGGDFGKAVTLFEESLGVFRQAADKWGIASSLNCLGETLQHRGDYDDATLLLRQSLALCREIGDRWLTAYPTRVLGIVAVHQRDYEAATALLDESLALEREMGDKWGTAQSLSMLASVASDERNYDGATRLLRESLMLRRDTGTKPGIAECLERLGGLAGATGQLARAARLLGAAEALRDAIGAPLPAADRAEYDRVMVNVRSGLTDERLREAWAEGRAMTLEQAIEYALAGSSR